MLSAPPFLLVWIGMILKVSWDWDCAAGNLVSGITRLRCRSSIFLHLYAILVIDLYTRGGHPDPLIADGGCHPLKSVNINGLVYEVADVARTPTDARRNHPDVTDLA